MKQPTSLYFLHAVSPLHVGVGEGVGAINLPIARERATGYPYLPGSSVKGVLREASELARGPDSDEVLTAFGPPQDRAADARGGLVFSDASLLCLPVRSLLGTFAWVTAPLPLQRLRRDAAEAGQEIPGLAAIGNESDAALVVEGSKLLFQVPEAGDTGGGNQQRGLPGSRLYLEELMVPARPSTEAEQYAGWLAKRLWPEAEGASHAHDFFLKRFAVVSDDLFAFLSRMAVEVRTRVRIDDETGTAAKSGPWQEEALPAESLLHGLVLGRRTRFFRIERDKDRILPRADGDRGEARTGEQALSALRGLLSPGQTLRFGGKASVGLGRARILVVP